MSATTASDPQSVLERFRQAAIDESAEDMHGVYAVNAVHEFPFIRTGVPSRMEGRDAILEFMTAFWGAGPLKYERYRTIAIHATADPDTIVVDQEVHGTSATTGSFVLPNLMIMTVRNGEITHLRDFANLYALDAAVGGQPWVMPG
jgi:ketosteroid isomerase-like protein